MCFATQGLSYFPLLRILVIQTSCITAVLFWVVLFLNPELHKFLKNIVHAHTVTQKQHHTQIELELGGSQSVGHRNISSLDSCCYSDLKTCIAVATLLSLQRASVHYYCSAFRGF